MADGEAWSGVRTTCPYCGVGCGISARVVGQRAVAVAGDRAHPANHGRLCSKGAMLGATVGLEGRLLRPMIGERQVSWDRATALVARRFSDTIARHGPDSVAFYVSGQLLTEDYYAANKLMKGFIGSANIDTNSRLCMASAVAAHKLAFGADLVPGCYEDLDLADLVIFAGHNAAWTHPVLYRRMEAARGRGQRHVVIDPRRTDTAEGADLHLALAPQSDVRLWNGLLAELDRRGALDHAFMDAHTNGWAEVARALGGADQSPDAVAADCGLAAADFSAFCDHFAATPRTVTLFSMGVNQSAQGVAKASAILNTHLATGRIGRPGACPFSITGQPNAMGGREVGGMANMLAAHMDFDEISHDRVRRFWSAPRLARRPGLKAIDMFEAVHDGRIKAIWIMATNPAVSLPRAGRVREALARCPFVVVSDCMADTDTMAFAQVKLPALAWGEKDGTVTNSERRISRQRPLMAPPGAARADWRIIAGVAAAMGHADAFAWDHPAQVFREHARLTVFENDGARPLDLGPLAGLSRPAYDALEPVRWPIRADGAGTPRLFEDGRYPTPDGRAALVPVRPAPPASQTSPGFPLSLNTGRVRDHWHTMTRTGLAPDLCGHAPEPVIDAHPLDAAAAGLKDGDLTRLITASGEAVAPVRFSDGQRRGGIFLPMHWTALYAPAGRANPLVATHVDPRSGQPEFKHTPARISPYRETWNGFAITREPQAAPAGLDLIWRRTPRQACHLHEFAGRGDERERAGVLRALGLDGPASLSLDDASADLTRKAMINGERLQAVVCMAPRGGRLPPRAWLVDRFADNALTPLARAVLLSGRAPGGADHGAIICACRSVGETAIVAAVGAGALDLDALGEATGAGVTCGSCRPELRRFIARQGARESDHVH